MTAEEYCRSLEPPASILVRFGCMHLIGEFDYEGDQRPICGARLVARTHRGTELVHMVSTACPNSGCPTAVSREEMHEYIEGSGGREFPFQVGGKILRFATIEDLNKQRAIDNDKAQYLTACKELIIQLELDMKLVEVEHILGGELLTFYYMSDERVDFRELVRQLAGQFKTRIDDIDIHFIHCSSPHEGALPLIISHGWPGSVAEFHKIIAKSKYKWTSQ